MDLDEGCWRLRRGMTGVSPSTPVFLSDKLNIPRQQLQMDGNEVVSQMQNFTVP